ncbi:hypothetical protein HAX54_033584, partial [Datura stramonium]|nr:hypothetical protein [Datura stramonium]
GEEGDLVVLIRRRPGDRGEKKKVVAWSCRLVLLLLVADDEREKERESRLGENERSGDVACGRWEEGDGGDGEREVDLLGNYGGSRGRWWHLAVVLFTGEDGVWFRDAGVSAVVCWPGVVWREDAVVMAWWFWVVRLSVVRRRRGLGGGDYGGFSGVAPELFGGGGREREKREIERRERFRCCCFVVVVAWCWFGFSGGPVMCVGEEKGGAVVFGCFGVLGGGVLAVCMLLRRRSGVAK